MLFFSQYDDLAHELLVKKKIGNNYFIISDKMIQTSFDGLYTCIQHS